MNDSQKFLPGDRVRLNEDRYDWWGYDQDTYHIADNAFEVRECVDHPTRGRLYTLAGFPYPVQEAWLMTEEEFEQTLGADAEEE